MLKEHVRVVKWVTTIYVTPVALVRIPLLFQIIIGVTYIKLTISNNCEAAIGSTFFASSLISRSYYFMTCDIKSKTLPYISNYLFHKIKDISYTMVLISEKKHV